MIPFKQTAWSVMGVASLTLTLISDLPVNAVSLTTFDASVITQATFPDVDLGLLAGFTEFQPGQTLNYDSTITDLGWSSTFSGTYLETPFEVTYSGDSSTFETTDTITWTGNGFFGADVWNSTGSALFSDTAIGFQIDFDNSVTLGSNTGMINTIIQASEDKTFLSTSGTGSINGIPLSDLSHGYEQETRGNGSRKYVSHWKYDKNGQKIPIFNRGNASPQEGESSQDSRNSTATIPEPSSVLATLTIGFFVLLLTKKMQSH